MAEPKQEPQTTPQEESIFTEADFSMQGYDKNIRRARNMLFIIAGFQLIAMALEFPLEDEVFWIVVGIHLFITSVFVGLAFWTKYKPYPALLTALIFYVSIFLIFGFLDTTNFFRGIILKIVVVILLVQGMRTAKEAEELKKAYGRS